MIEQFYFPEMAREERTPFEKSDEDYYPKYVSHSPFLPAIEAGFKVKIQTADISTAINEKTTRKETKRRAKKVPSKSHKAAVETVQEKL